MERRLALLMTDLVDSTRYGREVGDEKMSPLWDLHDRTARELLARWHGVEIEKTDGLTAVFDDASDALAYSMEYHRLLMERGFPLLARAALHMGPLITRETSADYVALGAKRVEIDGLVKPVTARILSVTTGGRTLASAEFRFHVGSSLCSWHSHGCWKLKGLEEPMELFEVNGDAASSVEPLVDEEKAYRVLRVRDLWVPARETAHTLPAERDEFIGRADAMSALAVRTSAGARLLSIIGTGGSGKTRLAIRFAWRALGEFPGGAWFCDLSSARTVDGICFASARGLAISLSDQPVTQIARAIAGRGRCLMILDNFEQVSQYAEETVGYWLEQAPEATFLVTTREVLGVAGEVAMFLPPMTEHDGVELFVRRARAARENYQPGAAELEAITKLVRGLDGLPLAMEIAAARVRVLSPSGLLAGLHERFDWRRPSRRQDRRSTLRAAFDWSWELLDQTEKSALAQLSVFEGGFTLESAESVLAPAQPRMSVVDTIEALISKSFVQAAVDDRFALLESVRQYAEDHLRASERFVGSGAAGWLAARERHWRHFGKLTDALASRAIGDADNLVAASRRAISQGDGEAAVQCIRATWALLRVVGPFRVCIDLANSALSIRRLSPVGEALAHWVAGSALDVAGDGAAARAHLLDGLSNLREIDASDVKARLLISLSANQTVDGELEAASGSLQAAEELARRAEDLRLQAMARIGVGKVMDRQGRLTDARLAYESALALARQAQDERLVGGITGNLGGIQRDLGELEEARRLFERSIDIAERVGDRRWAGNGYCNLGLINQDLGDLTRAGVYFERAGQIAREIGSVALEYTVLCNLGITAELENRFHDAADHFETAIAAAERAVDRRAQGQFGGYLAVVLAKLGDDAGARLQLVRAEQLLLGVSDRLSYALVLCQRAEVDILGRRSEQAVHVITQARGIAAELNAGPLSELGRRLASVDAALTKM